MVDYRSLIGKQWKYGEQDCYTLVRAFILIIWQLVSEEVEIVVVPEVTVVVEAVVVETEGTGNMLAESPTTARPPRLRT